MLSGGGLPDHLRCGSKLIYLTWPRLFGAAVAAMAATLLWTSLLTMFPPPGGSDLVLSDVAPPFTFSNPAQRLTPQSGGGMLAGLRLWSQDKPASKMRPQMAIKAGPMDRFCEHKGSTNFLDKWHLATLGAAGYPLASEADKYCDWTGERSSATEVPFKMCTFPREQDTQVSAYVHREGHWNAWKKEVFERMLPVLQARGALQPSPPPKEWAPPVDRAPQQLGADPFPERTLVIDVGANIGFYSMLFATRGYDVLALEPSKEAVIRLLMSLHGNGIRVARSGTEVGLAGSGSGRKGSGGAPLRGGVEGDASGASAAAAAAAAAALADGPLRSTRQPIVYAMQNAAGDAYAAAYLNYIADNPGASSVVADARADTVAQVFLDDLLAEGFRDPANGGKRPDPATAPAIDPRTVRAVKISAEGMDGRALHGMRRLLSLGEVPFVLFVFNRDHVRNAGCDVEGMMRAFFASGYRLYHAGVYIYREQELARFLRGVGGGASGSYARSMELLFVRWGADF